MSGVLIDFSTRRVMLKPVSELLKRGFDPSGLYVQVSLEERNDRVDPLFARTLAGRVERIVGSQLILADCRVQEVPAETAYLEASSHNLLRLIRELVSQNGDPELSLQARVFSVTGAKQQVERLETLRRWFEKHNPINCAKDLSFSFSNHSYQCKPGNEAGTYRNLATPDCVLRPGGSITVRWPVDPQIDSNGPFDTESFPRKQVRIAVVFPRELQGETEVFLRRLKEGVNSQDSRKPFKQGFVGKYRLSSCDFELYPARSDQSPALAYRTAALEALKKPYDLAIVLVRESHHQLYGVENPYYVTKATFMAQGVPVQEIEVETILAPSLPYILNNLALAMYAKLGGVPWVLSAAPTLTNEIVFGIGSARVAKERLGGSERIVGITTVFSGDGNYLLANSTKEVPYDGYLEALQSSLRETIQELKRRFGWQAKDKLRLIFHQSFKRYQKVEAAAVKQFVSQLTDYDVEYAFVHVGTQHNWKLFDPNFPGIRFGHGQKGEAVPQRGLSVPLGPKAALLTLTGAYQLKTEFDGCPRPILVSLHEDSTFNSLEYLVHQAYKFTFLSWRSFFPSTLPVTIYYSNLIAHLLGELRPLPNWNSDVLTTKLRESRWFL